MVLRVYTCGVRVSVSFRVRFGFGVRVGVTIIHLQAGARVS